MQLTVFSPRAVRIFFLQTVFAVSSLLAFHLTTNPAAVLVEVLIVYVLYLVVFRKFDYLDPLVAFSIPWLVILSFSLTPLSRYAISIHRQTDELVLMVLFAAVLCCGSEAQPKGVSLVWTSPKKPRKSMFTLHALDAALIGLTALNVALAGYVPLIRGIQTGDTGYLEFGVHGLYGFYLAFANAWAILHLVLYLRTKHFGYLLRFFFALFIFVLFVTRQNLLSVLVEALVTFSILRRRLTMKMMLTVICSALVLFSIAGSFRSGGIKAIANVQPKYYWVPDPFIWLYSYSYFNIANLDNLMHFAKGPSYDGSSFAQLIPSFLRPTYEAKSFIEVSNFNVSSYLYPVYQDLGALGVVLLTIVALRTTQFMRRSVYNRVSLFNVGTFATLYFCAAFSFFVNFWFYLPVIFQIVFFRLFSGLADRTIHQHLRGREEESDRLAADI